MNRTRYKSAILISLAILTSTCTTKTYDIELGEIKPRLVLDCYFTEGKPFKINVASSVGITSTEEFDAVDNATVSLYENDVYKEDLIWKNALGQGPGRGYYYSEQTFPESGNTYRVEVSAPGFDTVYAESILPGLTAIHYLEHKWIIEEEILFLQVNLQMDNPNSMEHFYFFVYARETWWYEGFPFFEVPLVNDPIVGNNEHEEYPEFLVFSNEFIQKDSYGFTIKLPSSDSLTLNSFERVYFNLATLSDDAYNFLITRTMQKNNDPRFSEPVRVYSNVDGGAGVFAGMNISCDSLILHDFGGPPVFPD